MKNTLAMLGLALGAAQLFGTNTLTVGASAAEGETITIGTTVFEIDLGGGVTAGRTAIDMSEVATAATGTLTFTANPTAGDTVTIGAKTYTYRAAVDAIANEVEIGATASDSLDNLIAAINGAAGSGTVYGSATVASTQVTAAAGSGDTLTLTAIVKGTGGNAIGTTETFTGSGNVFANTTLTSGANPSAANSIAGIVGAFNDSGIVRAVAITGGLVIVQLTGRGPLACTETLAGGGNAWLNATTVGATPGPLPSDAAPVGVAVHRAATAGEVSAGRMLFGFQSTVTAAFIQVRSSAGQTKVFDGKVVINGNLVTVDNSGDVDFAANDIVTLLVTV